jgi:hypothetical protein
MSVVFTGVKTVHVRKVAGGVNAYAEVEMKTVVHFWDEWRSDCPSMRQRYVAIKQETFRAVWHS